MSTASPAPSYAETSPAQSNRDANEDLAPLYQLLAGQPHACDRVTRDSNEILRIVRELGGSCGKYRRERSKAVEYMVSEIYSAPRVTKLLKMLPSQEVTPGFALDLTNEDESGRPWDFTKEECRVAARKKVDEEAPMFLIGSPGCTPYSSLQNANKNKSGRDEAERKKVEGDVHMRFVCELYRAQHAAGRYFLHEHPLCATSWKLEWIEEVLELDGVDTAWGDQCQYGQAAGGTEPVKKPTRWMSNSPELLRCLDQKCSGRRGLCSSGRPHAPCSGAAARRAAEYPVGLCKAIIKGCRNQLREDGRLRPGRCGIHLVEDELGSLSLEQLERKAAYMADHESSMDSEDAVYVYAVTGRPVEPAVREVAAKQFEAIMKIAPKPEEERFYDSVTGQPLRADLVRAARKEELKFFLTMQVWAKRRRSEAYERMGKGPISVKWVDTNKGDDEAPNYRSRLVAREIRRKGEDPIFAPTPPLESLRAILSRAATQLPGTAEHVRDPTSELRTQVSCIDIKRAYLCAHTDPDDPTYVELPPEDPDAGKDICALLLKHLYGTRKAGDGWHVEVSTTLTDDMGFVKGCASACLYRHPGRDIEVSIHGDDLTATGRKRDLDWYKLELEKHYSLEEAARLGPAAEDAKEAKVLNRIIRWTDAGLEYECDPRQVEQVIRDLGLQGCKAVGTPGVRQTFEQISEDRELERGKQRPYRAIAARTNYLAADRPDVQYAAKEICRWMASPTEQGLVALKRLGRYLEHQPRVVYRYAWQTADKIECYSDTDWAGCPRTRRSTSGGCVMVGSHLLKSWSSTQTPISLSSGEAEFYGVVRAASVAMGYAAMMEDLGTPLPVRVWTDSSATIGICSRRGLGRLRHVDTQCLWVQQRVRDGDFELRKVKGELNPADAFTKHLASLEKIRSLLKLFSCEFRGGRARTAPKLRDSAGSSSPGTAHPLLEVSPALDDAGVDMMNWDGHAYAITAVEFSDGAKMNVPEARDHNVAILPHQHANVGHYFPRAKAVAEELEVTESADAMMERGEALGRSMPPR